METVGRGLEWLKSHPRVKGDSIGVWGASKGSELALLCASLFGDIKAVVAKSASAYVFEGIGEEMGKVHKSAESCFPVDSPQAGSWNNTI